MKRSLLSWSVLTLLFAVGPASACPDIDGLPDLNCDRQLVIVCFGDSITVGVGDSTRLGYPGRLRQIFPRALIAREGVSGEKTSTGRNRAVSVFSRFFYADYAIYLEGVNDYFAERNASLTRDNLFSMVNTAQNRGIFTILSSLTDINRDFQRPWVLSVNSRIASVQRMNFFSLGRGIISSDRLHPNGSGYQAMANFAANVLRTLGAQNRPADTDSDGMYDFAEQRIGSNPLVADTDGDTLIDGEEVFVFGSSPTSTNTDGDQFTDQFEVRTLGSNPADPRPGPPNITGIQVVSP